MFIFKTTRKEHAFTLLVTLPTIACIGQKEGPYLRETPSPCNERVKRPLYSLESLVDGFLIQKAEGL